MFIYYIIIYVIRHLFKCKMISLYIYIFMYAKLQFWYLQRNLLILKY